MQQKVSKTNLKPLPESTSSFWEDAEKYQSANVPLKICNTHTKDKWLTHEGYYQDYEGIHCKFCGWGSPVPGYMRVSNEKVIDLRSAVRDNLDDGS